MELIDYNKETLELGIKTLETHIMNQGGTVESDVKFDPYKSSLSTTNYQKQKVPSYNQSADGIDSYDPAAVQAEIDKIQQ